MEDNKHLITEFLKEERLKKKYNCAICKEKTKRLVGYAYQGGRIYECDNSECPLNKLDENTNNRHIIDSYLIPNPSNEQIVSDIMTFLKQYVSSHKIDFSAKVDQSTIRYHMNDDDMLVQIERRYPTIKERREFVISRLRYMYFSKKYGMTYEQYKSAKGQLNRDGISVIRFIDNLYFRNRERKYFINEFNEFRSTKRPYVIVKKKVVFPTPVKSYLIDISTEEDK